MTKPSDKDIEKADAIVKDWYEGWLKCPTWTEAFQKYGVQEISKAIAAERASLPMSVVKALNIAQHYVYEISEGQSEFIVHLEEALADLRKWKAGE